MDKFLIRIGNVTINIYQIVDVMHNEDGSLRINTTRRTGSGKPHYVTVDGPDTVGEVMKSLSAHTVAFIEAKDSAKSVY